MFEKAHVLVEGRSGATWTAASLLTVLRALIGASAGCLLLVEGCSTRVFLLLVIATAGDGLDGAIARRRRQETALGALLDPIADKIVLTTVYGAMAVRAQSAAIWAMFLLGAVRDVAVTARRLSVYRRAGKVLGSQEIGKLKTAVQSLGALGVVFYARFIARSFGFSSPAVILLFSVTVALSLVSWGRYTLLRRGDAMAK